MRTPRGRSGASAAPPPRRRSPRSSGFRPAHAEAFLDDESLDSGLLVSRTEGEFEFWHLTFQEYLAALELVALELTTAGEYWRRVHGRLFDDRWNEVILLLAGCLLRTGGLRAARGFIERVLSTGSDLVGRARAVGLLGRVLSDLRPYGGDPSVGTGYQEALRETRALFKPGGEPAPEEVRVEVGEALGQAGDPRLADPEANRVRIAGGRFRMGAQKENRGARASTRRPTTSRRPTTRSP